MEWKWIEDELKKRTTWSKMKDNVIELTWDNIWWNVNKKKQYRDKVDLKIRFKWNNNDTVNEMRMEMRLKNEKYINPIEMKMQQ